MAEAVLETMRLSRRFGALLVGVSDTFGKVLLPGFSSTIVYAVMAAVLVFRPRGLLGLQG